MKRAYSIVEITETKEADANGKRFFTGIASTPTVDRMGDIVEPKGAIFKLPIPLLWQHRSSEPIGWVVEANVTDTGIAIRGEVAVIAEESDLRRRIEDAWLQLKHKLVRGLSIGFDPIEHSHIDGTWGYRFTKWEWLELSCVTIPANAEASIAAIKSADTALLVASGRERRGVVQIPPHCKEVVPVAKRAAIKLIPRKSQ